MEEINTENSEENVDLELDTKEEKEKTPTPEKKQEPSQKSLNWREKLPDDLRKSDSMMKFKTIEDLSRSYMSLESRLGKVGKLDIDSLDSSDKERKALSLMFGKKDYKVSDDFLPLAKKHFLPPAVAKEIDEELQSIYKEKEKKNSFNKVSEYKTELKAIKSNDANLERYLNVGLKKMGMSFEKYKDIFKDEHLNPKIVSLFAEQGKKSMSERHIEIEEGKTGGLPSNLEDLKQMLIKSSRDLLMAQNITEKNAINQQIEEIQAKMNKTQQKSSSLI